MTLPTPTERAEFGRQARARVPRSSHGEWGPPPDRTDPIDILVLQAITRVPELVPSATGGCRCPVRLLPRCGAVMASDLAARAHSGLEAQLCGTPTCPTSACSPRRSGACVRRQRLRRDPSRPFEWDVKRLAASLEIAGRGQGSTEAAPPALEAASSRLPRPR